MPREPAKEYNPKEVLASFDFCIAALENDREEFTQAIIVMKAHREKFAAKHFQKQRRVCPDTMQVDCPDCTNSQPQT